MEADFGLVGLKKVLKKFTHGDDALGVRRDRLKVADVLAVESTEDKINFFLLVWYVAEWCEIGTEVLHRKYRAGGVDADWFVIWTSCYEWQVRFGTEHVIDLAIPEKEHYAWFHDVLEDEILVIVANFVDIWQY